MSETILQEAIRLTSSDRQGQYGHPAEHFARTVAGLNARFGSGKDPLFARDMEPQEWPLMVAIDKLVGRGNDTRNIKRDSLVDVPGYCRTYEMVGEYAAQTGKRIYIAGKMRGIFLYNFPEFDRAAEYLRGIGKEPINPAQLDRDAGFDPVDLPSDHDWTGLPPGFDFAACRKRDLDALETCREIYMLKGWRDSVGARAEHAHAEWIGLKIIEQE